MSGAIIFHLLIKRPLSPPALAHQHLPVAIGGDIAQHSYAQVQRVLQRGRTLSTCGAHIDTLLAIQIKAHVFLLNRRHWFAQPPQGLGHFLT